MTSYDPGDVVLVRFPFTDLSTSKKRPALVISPPGYASTFGDVVVLALTSRPQADGSRPLVRWRDAGLPKPTWIKPLIATLASSTLQQRVGSIHVEDVRHVVNTLRALVAAEFQPATTR